MTSEGKETSSRGLDEEIGAGQRLGGRKEGQRLSVRGRMRSGPLWVQQMTLLSAGL